MYSLNYKNTNIITFPKCGCTMVIKLCTNTLDFKNHNHDFKHNQCSLFGNIHNCGHQSFEEISSEENYVIFRYPHERIESFYYSNYLGNSIKKDNQLSLEDFVCGVLENRLNNIPGLIDHVRPIVNYKNKIDNHIFIHLNNLNDFFFKKFNEDISEYFIINKSLHKIENCDSDLIEKCKKRYKNEYKFLENKTAKNIWNNVN